MQGFEVSRGQVSLSLDEAARAQVWLLSREIVVDESAQGEPILAAPVGSIGLRVLAERDLGKGLLGRRPRGFGTEHPGGAEQ